MKMLIAEQDAALKYGLARLLRKLDLPGFKFTPFSNGNTVLEEISKELFDIVFLGRVRGEISAFEVLGKLREIKPAEINSEITVIAIARDKSEAKLFWDSGANEVLLLPLNLKELEEAIAFYLEPLEKEWGT